MPRKGVCEGVWERAVIDVVGIPQFLLVEGARVSWWWRFGGLGGHGFPVLGARVPGGEVLAEALYFCPVEASAS